MIETVAGGLVGGIFRLFPEVINYFGKKEERKHEIEMIKVGIDADKARAEYRLKEAEFAANAATDTAYLQAFAEAQKSQGKKTGIVWVDAISQTVRPFLTYWWCVVLYTVAMGCQFSLALDGGMDMADAFLSIWGPSEKAIVSSIFSFWFVDRAIVKGRHVGH